MSVLLSDMDDMDVAGAMLLIGTKNDASDKPIFASTGAVGTKRKKRDIISLTQVCAPNQAKKKKKKAAPKNKNKMGDSPTWSFSGYDDDNWQMQEYYDIDRANVPVNPERSPAQHSRASEAASVSPRKTKRKLLVQTGKGVALKGAEKPPPGNIKESKANAAADPLVLSWRYVGPDSAPSPDRYELEIEFLKRQIAEDTVKLEEAVRRKNEAVSLNRREAQRANRAVPAQQSSRSASPGQQQRDGASSSHPVNQSKVASALSAYTHHLQKLSVDTAASQTGAKGASKKQLNDRKRGKKPRRSKKKAATSFISLTPITDGGKFKFAESRDFKVDEPDDDTSIPPARKKMAEWEMQVNRGQWRRLRRFTVQTMFWSLRRGAQEKRRGVPSGPGSSSVHIEKALHGHRAQKSGRVQAGEQEKNVGGAQRIGSHHELVQQELHFQHVEEAARACEKQKSKSKAPRCINPLCAASYERQTQDKNSNSHCR